jgi:thymidylate kinase
MFGQRRRRREGVGARRRPLVVAFVGIDGSGKTTQAHRLAAALSASGAPAIYCQNAGGRRWFGRLAQWLGCGDAERLLGRNVLVLAEATLRWLALARALARSFFRRRAAVMDRHAACQYASIRARGTRWEAPARIAYRIFPPPDVTFLLSVAPAEAYRRIEARGTDHESLAFLVAADAAYRSLPEYDMFIIIDANGTPDETTRAIRNHLWSYPTAPSTPEPCERHALLG